MNTQMPKQVLIYYKTETPCPHRHGVFIMSPECKACEHYRGECVTQRMLCGHGEENH